MGCTLVVLHSRWSRRQDSNPNLPVEDRVSAPEVWFFGRDGWIRTNDRSFIRRLLYPRATSLW